jgi:G3E family GTPase
MLNHLLTKSALHRKGRKLAVLVNEFGQVAIALAAGCDPSARQRSLQVGIDGSILAETGGSTMSVVELPNGCVCCTLDEGIGISQRARSGEVRGTWEIPANRAQALPRQSRPF